LERKGVHECQRQDCKEIHKIDEPTRLALHIEIDNEGKVKYRSPDKNVAREQLMKYLGLFEKDNRQQSSVEVHVEGVRKVIFEPIPKTRKGLGVQATEENQPATINQGFPLGKECYGAPLTVPASAETAVGAASYLPGGSRA
jgi:hypothetical protein